MLLLWAFAGALAEGLNALTRQWAVTWVYQYRSKGTVWLLIGGYLFRLAWLALVLGWAFSRGPVPGMAAFGGYWIAHWMIILLISRSRRQPE